MPDNLRANLLNPRSHKPLQALRSAKVKVRIWVLKGSIKAKPFLKPTAALTKLLSTTTNLESAAHAVVHLRRKTSNGLTPGRSVLGPSAQKIRSLLLLRLRNENAITRTMMM